MFDPIVLSALITPAVAVISRLLEKAAEKGVEEAGKSIVSSLFDKLKGRLKHAGARDALGDLSQQPSHGDTQAALRVQLKKAIEEDPSLFEFVQRWKADCGVAEAVLGTTQTANVSGDSNIVIQSSGPGNSIHVNR